MPTLRDLWEQLNRTGSVSDPDYNSVPPWPFLNTTDEQELCDWFHQYCDIMQFPQLSADELLCFIRVDHPEWETIRRFINHWEQCEEQWIINKAGSITTQDL